MGKDNTQTTVSTTVTPAGENTVTPTDYTKNVTTSIHTNEHHQGHRVDFNTDTDTDVDLSGSFDDRVEKIVKGDLLQRKIAEDKRANARNRNRLWILVAVLVMELIVPTLYGWGFLPALFVKYEVLAITLPDALLTVYAFIRKY